MHHNLRHALDDFQKASANLHNEMSSLSPEDIKEAFANNGYLDMKPKLCRYVSQNEAGQWMYDCVWNGEDSYDDNESTYITRIFVSIAVDKLIADV